MFQKLRKRIQITPATIIASLALVFAMTGGAYAAGRYVITSTKQISPKVLKSLKGANGKNGVNGTNGAPGAQGPAGPAGPQGPAGAAGTAGVGTEGKKGETGPKGETGATGAPGPTVKELAAGQSEHGVWAFSGKGQEEFGEETKVLVPISFPIPLNEVISAEDVHFIGEGEASPSGCTGGTVAKPAAEPGNLCVWVHALTSASFRSMLNPESTSFLEGAGKGGTLLNFAEVLYQSEGFGVWVVTAK
jgi:hypothetical protein